MNKKVKMICSSSTSLCGSFTISLCICVTIARTQMLCFCHKVTYLRLKGGEKSWTELEHLRCQKCLLTLIILTYHINVFHRIDTKLFFLFCVPVCLYNVPGFK